MAPKKATAPSTSTRETRTKTGKITPRQFPVIETKSETTRTKSAGTKKPAAKTKTTTKKTTTKKPAAKANTSAKVTKTKAPAKKKQPVKGAILKAEGKVLKKPGKKAAGTGKIRGTE